MNGENISQSTLMALKILHKTFWALGLAPCDLKIFTPRGSKITLKYSKSRKNCIYNIFLLISIIFIFCYLSPKYVTKGLPSLERKIAMSALATVGNISAFIIIISHTVCQRKYVKLGNNLCEFDEIVDFSRPDEYFQHLIHALSITLLWLGLLITEGLKNLSIWQFIIHVPNSMVCCWFVLQYSLVGISLRMRFQQLNKLFSKSDAANSPVKSFQKLRETRNFLWKTTRKFSKFYSLPILFAIGNLCFDATIGVYYSVAHILNSTDVIFSTEAINGLCWASVQISPIVYLSMSIEKLIKEINTTPFIVNNLSAAFKGNKDVISWINEFYLELFHKEIAFTAYGLCSLDCSLLFSVISTLVTYEIIAVKFDQLDGDDVPNIYD